MKLQIIRNYFENAVSTQWLLGFKSAQYRLNWPKTFTGKTRPFCFGAKAAPAEIGSVDFAAGMYSTARRTTLVDYNQRHSPSTISKSSLQLIHLRRIVSISLFAKNNHLPNRCRRMRTISGRHLSSHSSDSSSDYENPLSCDSTHIDSVLRPGPSFTNNIHLYTFVC